MLLTDFLSLILPSEGVKCWVSIHDKKVSQGFETDLDKFATVLQGIDTQQWDAYFACASYKETGSRKRENALAAKAFWLDIDAGPGKPYENADAALEALEAFTDRVGLQNPIIVKSGNGIHAYWVLDRPLPAVEWSALSGRFKEVVAFHGLHADPSRTADISSILRVPGTHNWKNRAEPKAVYTVYDDYEITSVEAFVKLSADTARPVVRQSLTSSLASLASGPKNPPPSFKDGIADGSGRTAGMMTRIGWCLGPGKMTYEQACATIFTWNKLNMPPIEDAKVAAAIDNIYAREASKPVANAVDSSDTTDYQGERMPNPPTPFMWGGRGQLVHRGESDNGIAETITVSEYPIFLADVCCREHEIATSYVFKQYHPHNGWREFYIRADEFMGQSCHGLLTYNGADITDIKKFKYIVQHWAVTYKGKKMDSYRYEQFGWKEDGSFLLGNNLYQRGGLHTTAYGDDKVAKRMEYMRLPSNGSLTAWSAAANRLYALGMEAYGFALLSSFAAPLMEFCVGESEGGAILSLYSGQSGRGKTRTLEAIASVWGRFDALATIASDTTNARFGTIAVMRNLPVIYEELTEMDPMNLRKMVKDFTAGREKNRAQRDGSVPVKESRFKTILVTASNISVLETLRASHDEGAVARVLELDINKSTSTEFDPKRLENTLDIMKANRAFAGRMFIENLQLPENLEKAKGLIDHAKTHYRNLLETQPEDRFVAMLLACMLVAAKLVNDWHILSFDIDRVMEWGVVKARDRVMDSHKRLPSRSLASFITQHVFECLTVSGPVKNRYTPINVISMPTRGLSIRNERESSRMYISADAIRNWSVKNHISITDMAKELTDKGILLNQSRVITLTAGTDFPAVRLPCWEIDTSHAEVSGSLHVVAAAAQAGDPAQHSVH